MKGNQIKYGAILSYVSIAINIVAGLLYTPWMIEQIGESDYGLYTLANSLITLFLVDFGLSAATTLFVSKYVAEGQIEKANTFLGTVYKLYLLIDAVIGAIFVVVFFCIDWIYVSLSPDELAKFKVVYCIAAGYAIANFPFVTLNGVLTSYEKFVYLKFADIIQRVLTVGLTIAALYGGMGLYALVFVNAISGLIAIAYKYAVVRKATPAKANFRKSDRAAYKSIFVFSFWSTVATIAQRLIFNITPTVLGIVSNSIEIAIFGVVTTIEQYVYTFTTAINGMFMPKISRIYAEDSDGKELFPLMVNVGRFQFALNGLLIVGFALLGESFMRLWMGDGFSETYIGILLVIIPGLFFNSLQVANTAMLVKNKVKEQAAIAVIIGLINLMCSFVLSNLYGAIGACVSIFIAYTIRAVLYHVVQHKVMHFDMKQFAKQCYLRMTPAILLSGIVGWAINYLIADGGWIVFGVKGALIVGIYGICVLLFGLSRKEKQDLCSYIKRRVKI